MITFLAGQVAATLTWLTLSAEEAPELIACAPASAGAVRNAKLAAGLAPLVAASSSSRSRCCAGWRRPPASPPTLGAGAAALARG